MGYYLTLGLKVPEDAALTISNVSFENQTTNNFNVTFFNPSYSRNANITGVFVRTADNMILNMSLSNAILPLTIPRASDTFNGRIAINCLWNWANYTGQKITVLASLDKGSGPTREVQTPFVGLTITDVHFNASISVTHFNFTVRNSLDSVTYVNISQIVVPMGILENQTSPVLPYRLDVGKNVNFTCNSDWTNHQNRSIAITVLTAQGYTAFYNRTGQLPLVLDITNIDFSEPDTTHFNVTVRNRTESLISVNISRITMTLENGTQRTINGTSPTLPLELVGNSSVTFKCPFDWTRYREKDATITVLTAQNYTASYTKATPSPIEITQAIFNPADTTIFNITVHNSAYYYMLVHITNVTLTFENGTVREINETAITPELPHVIGYGDSISLRCPWDWTDYQGRNVTITAKTSEGYLANLAVVTPKRVILTITTISFDSTNTGVFEITLRNSAQAVENANITRITVTLENGTVKEVPSIGPLLPYLLSPSSTVKFRCQWDWSNYRGKNITITVYATKGYIISSRYTTPPIQ
jgi:hypothetical protein